MTKNRYVFYFGVLGFGMSLGIGMPLVMNYCPFMFTPEGIRFLHAPRDFSYFLFLTAICLPISLIGGYIFGLWTWKHTVWIKGHCRTQPLAVAVGSSQRTGEAGFVTWYKTGRLGKFPVPVQAILWLLYGFIWIPVWYCCNHGQFGEWHKERLGRLPVVIQVIIWTLYGFIWIPAWYFSGKGRKGNIS